MNLCIYINIPKRFDEEICNARKKIVRQLQGVKIKNYDNFHITLANIKIEDEFQLNKVKNIVKNFRFSQFELSLDDIGVFNYDNQRLIAWIGAKDNIELFRTHINLSEQLRHANFDMNYNLFNPHISLTQAHTSPNAVRILPTIKPMSFNVNTIQLVTLDKSTGKQTEITSKTACDYHCDKSAQRV